MERRRFLYGLASGLAPLLVPKTVLAALPEIAVVCNPASGVTSMTRAQLQPIFRMRSQQFPGGGRVSVVNLPADHVARQVFDRAVLGLEPDEVERFWIDNKIRSGTGSPRSLSGPAVVARFVATERTALGYLPAADAGAGMRVVALVRGLSVIPS